MRTIWRTYYIAALLVIPVSVNLLSTIRWIHQSERQSLIRDAGSFLVVLQLDKQAAANRYDAILGSAAAIKGIQIVQLEQPIPSWNGAAGLEESWTELWKSYSKPVIMVSIESSEVPIDSIPTIVETLSAISGVEGIIWDESKHADMVKTIQLLDEKQWYITGFYLTGLLWMIVGLILSYPIVLRRKYVVMTGLYGAGSQIDPETVLFKLILQHGKAAIAIHLVISVLAYVLMPKPLMYPSVLNAIFHMFENAVVIVGIVTAIFLVGWWQSASREISEVVTIRPPHYG